MKTTKEMIEVMKAYDEGKEIECASKNQNNWGIAKEPRWDWLTYDYRVKEKYRPYKDTEEMINDFCIRFKYTYQKIDSLPFFIWVKQKEDEIEVLVSAYNKKDNAIFIINWVTLEYLFNNYTYLDGSPCGIKE